MATEATKSKEVNKRPEPKFCHRNFCTFFFFFFSILTDAPQVDFGIDRPQYVFYALENEKKTIKMPFIGNPKPDVTCEKITDMKRLPRRCNLCKVKPTNSWSDIFYQCQTPVDVKKCVSWDDQSLTIRDSSYPDRAGCSGCFQCTASNTYGEATFSFFVKVFGKCFFS